MFRSLALAFAGLLVAEAAAAQARPAPVVQTREIGQLVLENIPTTPSEVREALRRYQNARSASFQDWLGDGSMLITTRFGQTAQLHRVAAPGAARTQLTFFDEPVIGAAAQPGTDRFVYARDTGGAEYYQAYLASARGGPEIQITEPGSRNQALTFSDDGRRLVWARVSRGDPNYDIMMMDVGDPSSRRVVHEGQGAIAPLDISPDGRSLLLGRSYSVNHSERFLLDLASGRLTEINPRSEEVAYGGGEFTPDGRAVVLLSDQGSEVRRLVQLDLTSNRQVPLSPADSRWEVESFDLSDDGRLLAYALNEDGWSRVVVQDFRTRRALPQPQLPRGGRGRPGVGAGQSPAGGHRVHAHHRGRRLQLRRCGRPAGSLDLQRIGWAGSRLLGRADSHPISQLRPTQDSGLRLQAPCRGRPPTSDHQHSRRS
jgi:hypothetical protein